MKKIIIFFIVLLFFANQNYCGPCTSKSSITSANVLLLMAAQYGDIEKVQEALAIGADKDTQDNDGYTALIFAASCAHKEVVKFLINAGANKDIKNKCGNTALIWAATYGYKEIVELLINGGADKDIRNNFQKNALYYAKEFNHQEVVNFYKAKRQEKVKESLKGPLGSPDAIDLICSYVGED